jgi:hypothetical protein
MRKDKEVIHDCRRFLQTQLDLIMIIKNDWIGLSFNFYCIEDKFRGITIDL